MTTKRTATDKLREKYGAEAIEAGKRLQPTAFERRLALRDAIDPNFAKLRVDFAILGMSRRKVLDERTRLLILIGQFTMVRNERALEEAIRAAIAAKVPIREVAEIIIQCAVYGGDNAVDPGLDVLARVVDELGLLEELQKSQLPIDGHDRERSLEAERQEWDPDDVNDPRLEPLLERHGWLAVSTGLRMRPKHHLNVLSYFGAFDQEFADLWVKFTYQGMYSRWLVDNKTRLLCMVGDCIAVGETGQGKSHMRGAMRQGATPREVLEVLFQSTVYFGMPWLSVWLRNFVEIVAEQGRLDEIGNPPRKLEER